MLPDPATVAENERYSIWNGSFAMMGLTIVGTFVPLLLLDALHGTPQQVALLSSLPAMVSMVAVILGAVVMARSKSQRRLCGWSVILARATVFLVALAPVVVGAQASWAVVVLYALMNFPSSLANLTWQSLMAGLIPENRRAVFFAQRQKITNIAGMAIAVVTGLVLQAFNPADRLPYVITLAVAGSLGAFEAYYLFRHREPEVPADLVPQSFLEGWRRALKHPPFAYFFLSSMIFNFAWQCAWPLFSIFQISTAHATAIWVALFGVFSQLGSIFTFDWWGRMSVTRGLPVMLVVAGLGIAMAPGLTVLSTNLWYLLAINLYTGVFLAGVQLLLFNQLLGVSLPEDRTNSIGLYNVGLGIVGFIAPELGIVLLHAFGMSGAMWISGGLRGVTAIGFIWAARAAARAGKRAVIESAP